MPMRTTTRTWLIIFVVAAGIRVAMLVDFAQSNPLAQHVGGDAGFYWERAGQIEQGSVPAGPFQTAPLYPYFLAAVRYLGGGLTSVFILQNLIHLATGLLLGWTVRRRIGGTAAIVAVALFFGLTEPAFRANRLLPSTLQLFLVTGLMAAAQSFTDRPRVAAGLIVGSVTGFFALAYPAAMILIPIVVLGLLTTRISPINGPPLNAQKREAASTNASAAQGERRGRSNRIAIALVGTAAALAPVASSALYNWRACAELIPITAHAGITMHQGNTHGSTGTYTAVSGVRTFKKTQSRDTERVFANAHGRHGSHREVDRFFRQKGTDYLRADLGRAAKLMGRKLYWFLTGRYYSDIYHPALEQDSGLLHLLPLAPLPASWLMGSTLVGFVLLRRRNCLSVLDLSMFLLPLLVVLVFYYSPRYRLPALPIMCLASAATASHVIDHWRRKTLGGWKASMAFLLVTAPVPIGSINNLMGFDRAENHRPEFECNRGQLLAQRGNFKEAILHLQKSTRLLPGQPVVLASLATALIQVGDLSRAEKVLTQLTAIAPESLSTWLTAGTLELRRNDPIRAERSFAQALRQDPNDAEASLGMWFALAAQNRKREGLPHLQRCLEIDPTNAPATGEFGLWLAGSGKLEQAYDFLTRAVQLAPNLARTHYNLGVFLLNAGRAVQAVGHLETALEIEPGYDKAREALARARGWRAGSNSSIDALKGSLRAHPEDESAYSRLAGALFARGDIAEALDVLRTGVERAQHSSRLAVELAWLLATNKDSSLRSGAEALRVMHQVMAQEPEPIPEMLDVLAAAYAETGEFALAVQHAESAHRLAMELERADLARSILGRIDSYRKKQPFRR